MSNTESPDIPHWSDLPCATTLAHELRDELGEPQLQRLSARLKTTTYPQWLDWLVASQTKLGAYEELSPKKRQSRLLSAADDEPLMLQHALLWLEMLRAHMGYRHLHLSPSGPPRETQQGHREIVLGVVSAYWTAPDNFLWPFDDPAYPLDYWPFADN